VSDCHIIGKAEQKLISAGFGERQIIAVRASRCDKGYNCLGTAVSIAVSDVQRDILWSVQTEKQKIMAGSKGFETMWGVDRI
jgi:hypothetical protein